MWSLKEIRSPNAPEAIGPYSQAIEVGGFLYCSGQIGLDPQSGLLVSGGVHAEARQALSNLMAILTSAGYSADDVVKTQVYLLDMGDFQKFNAIYAEYFKRPFPARACVSVVGLPKGAVVEVEAIAFRQK